MSLGVTGPGTPSDTGSRPRGGRRPEPPHRTLVPSKMCGKGDVGHGSSIRRPTPVFNLRSVSTDRDSNGNPNSELVHGHRDTSWHSCQERQKQQPTAGEIHKSGQQTRRNTTPWVTTRLTRVKSRLSYSRGGGRVPFEGTTSGEPKNGTPKTRGPLTYRGQRDPSRMTDETPKVWCLCPHLDRRRYQFHSGYGHQ